MKIRGRKLKRLKNVFNFDVYAWYGMHVNHELLQNVMLPRKISVINY